MFYSVLTVCTKSNNQRYGFNKTLLVYHYLSSLDICIIPYSYNISFINYRKPFSLIVLGTMNHSFPFVLPRVFGRAESTTPPQPVAISQSQEQTSLPPPPSQRVTNNETNTNHNSDIHPTSPPPNSSNAQNDSGLVTLYHKGSINFVLDQYCLPTTDTTWAHDDKCKFNRDCILTKTKLSNHVETNTVVSPTVLQFQENIF